MSVQSSRADRRASSTITLNAEITITTASIPADTGGGGVRLNMILKDGATSSAVRHSGWNARIWVANNTTRGYEIETSLSRWHRSPRSIYRTLGGPSWDRLSWIFSARIIDRNDDSDVPKYLTAPTGKR